MKMPLPLKKEWDIRLFQWTATQSLVLKLWNQKIHKKWQLYRPCRYMLNAIFWHNNKQYHGNVVALNQHRPREIVCNTSKCQNVWMSKYQNVKNVNLPVQWCAENQRCFCVSQKHDFIINLLWLYTYFTSNSLLNMDHQLTIKCHGNFF